MTIPIHFNLYKTVAADTPAELDELIDAIRSASPYWALVGPVQVTSAVVPKNDFAKNGTTYEIVYKYVQTLITEDRSGLNTFYPRENS